MTHPIHPDAAPTTPPNEMGWGEAFNATLALLWVRRKCWPAGQAVTWQIRDEYSKMCAPYLHQRSVYEDTGVVYSAWVPLNEDMWARDWEIGTGESA